MKKNKDREPASKGWQFFLIATIFIIVLLFLSYNAFGGSWTKYQVLHNADIDSARVSLKTVGSATVTTLLTSFPDSVLLTMDSAKSYTIEVYVISGTDKYSWFDMAIPALTSNATIGSIAGGWIDSNKTEQGGIAGANISLHVIAYDTLNDDSVSGVVLTLQDASGTTKDNKITYSNGTQDFTVTAGDWTLVPDKAWYVFDDSTYTVSANDTIYIYGYLWSPATIVTSDSDKCTLYGYIIGADGYPAQLALVEIIQAENAYDTCNNRMVIRQVLRAETNAGGIWDKTVLRSKCYDSKNYYNIKVTYNGETKEKSIEVPDSASHRVTF